MIAIAVNLRFNAFLHLPAYVTFRILRFYFTLESVLLVTFNRYGGYPAEIPGAGADTMDHPTPEHTTPRTPIAAG